MGDKKKVRGSPDGGSPDGGPVHGSLLEHLSSEGHQQHMHPGHLQKCFHSRSYNVSSGHRLQALWVEGEITEMHGPSKLQKQEKYGRRHCSRYEAILTHSVSVWLLT